MLQSMLLSFVVQFAKWKEYEERHTEERKRLRDYLAAVKVRDRDYYYI